MQAVFDERFIDEDQLAGENRAEPKNFVLVDDVLRHVTKNFEELRRDDVRTSMHCRLERLHITQRLHSMLMCLSLVAQFLAAINGLNHGTSLVDLNDVRVKRSGGAP